VEKNRFGTEQNPGLFEYVAKGEIVSIKLLIELYGNFLLLFFFLFNFERGDLWIITVFSFFFFLAYCLTGVRRFRKP